MLAGNHDVGQKDDDYTAYKANFGAARYDANPWYGESFEDNRGHYDLITAGGMDFLMLYQGWAPSQEGIDWLNEVLARYPERTAILNLHEYMLTTGGLGEVPQQIYDEVVAPNANVAMVFSGHYHDAFTRIDQFDDTGDGIPDRSVYQMLFDYQGLPEGGQSFLRLLQFDNENRQIGVRTYSPYLDAYNSADPTLELQHQEFAVPYAAFGLTPMVKSLATDAFTVDILTTTEIAAFADVASGTEVTAAWNPGAGTHGWYAFSADPFGASAHSEVRRLTVEVPAVVEPAALAPVAVPGASASGAVADAPAAREAVAAFALSAESQALADTAAAALEAEVAADAQTERSDAAQADADDRDPDLAAVDEVGALGIWTVALVLLALLAAAVFAAIAARRIRSGR